MIPLAVIVPPVDAPDYSTLVSYIIYILIVVIGAIFATEYAAWRIGHKIKAITNKFKGYEEQAKPFMDMINKIDPKQIDAVLKNIGELTATIKLAIEKPQEMPDLPPVPEEKEKT